MEADILAFAQQVCTDAYVEGQIASAEAVLWVLQLTAAISGAVVLVALVVLAISAVLDAKGHDVGPVVGIAIFVACFAAAIALIALINTGPAYQSLLSWQNDPITQAVKDITEAI